MTRNTSAVLIVIIMSAYFLYNRFYVYPQELQIQAESMLVQMADREEWFDVPEVMARVEAHKAHLEIDANISSTSGKRASSEGYIT